MSPVRLGASDGGTLWLKEADGVRKVWPLGNPAVDYPAAVLADSPVGYWPMQEASGNLSDSSGNGRTASKVGDGTLTYGVDGPVAGVKAIEFPGTSGTGFSAADADAWSPANLTFEAWIYMGPSFFDGEFARYFILKHAGGVTDEWYGGIFNNSGLQLVMQTTNTGNTHYLRRTLAAGWGSEGAWYHVAYTITGTTSAMYLNGVAVGVESGSGTRRSNSSGVLAIGHGPTVASRSWKGRLCHVAVYNTALSGTRIAAHYAAMAGG